MSEALLEIQGLRIEATSYPPGEKPRKVTLVDDVSLRLEKGKVLGLIGESRAGKSTIGLSSMAYGRGGVQITGGQIWLKGRDILQGGAGGLRALRGREVTLCGPIGGGRVQPGQAIDGASGRGDAEARTL